MRLSELGIIGGLELDRTDPCFHLEPLGTIGDAFVERLVELAAGIEDNGGFGITRLSEGCGQQHPSKCGGGPRNEHHGLLSEWRICSIDYPSHRVREQTDQRYGIVNRANAALFQPHVDPANMFHNNFGLPEQTI